MQSLNDIASGTDKFALGYVDDIYNRLFEPIKYTTRSVLEIGIQYGESLKLWRDYFINAKIYGVDIEQLVPQLYDEPRITPIYTDAYNINFVDMLQDDHFDVIIDDGPHTFESMVFFLSCYLRKVKTGGYLILEDIVDTNWTSRLVNVVDMYSNLTTVYNMAGKQKTAELRVKWAGGLDAIVIQKGTR